MITMEDIARISGYSRITVSAALRNKAGVSEKARKKIMEVAEKYNYTPNLMAMSLKGQPSHLIGVVVRDICNPYYGLIIEGIESAVSSQGYTLLTLSTREDHEREVQALRTLSSYQVDGLILAPILRGIDLEHIWLFSRNGKPLITFEKVPGFGFDYVDFEDEKGGYLATEYLIKKGHRRICYLAGPETSKSSHERYEGFQKALSAHGIASEENRKIVCGNSSHERFCAASALLSDPVNRPTALFCFSDLVTVDVYKAAQNLGLHIPQDLSVIGFDDIELASVLGPPLTTVSYSIYDVGHFVGGKMVDFIRHKKQINGLEKVFKPRLVERGSVASIAH